MPSKILIIDDELDIRIYLAAALEDAGYETAALGNEEPGLSAIAAINPDLIILDIMMPGRSGISIYRELRADERLKDTKVVLFSGMPLSREALSADFESLSGDDSLPPPQGFLEKPLNLDALKNLIKKLLGT
ncbi:MAG: response regulator [Deltaproteobacteria bacterium]|nr:response regulator [Deltaproteobacteria bacterium]